jgi:hypothetical protein
MFLKKNIVCVNALPVLSAIAVIIESAGIHRASCRVHVGYNGQAESKKHKFYKIDTV